jgi:hypothetical protein
LVSPQWSQSASFDLNKSGFPGRRSSPDRCFFCRTGEGACYGRRQRQGSGAIATLVAVFRSFVPGVREHKVGAHARLASHLNMLLSIAMLARQRNRCLRLQPFLNDMPPQRGSPRGRRWVGNARLPLSGNMVNGVV